jgi:hypothetical protein
MNLNDNAALHAVNRKLQPIEYALLDAILWPEWEKMVDPNDVQAEVKLALKGVEEDKLLLAGLEETRIEMMEESIVAKRVALDFSSSLSDLLAATSPFVDIIKAGSDGQGARQPIGPADWNLLLKVVTEIKTKYGLV